MPPPTGFVVRTPRTNRRVACNPSLMLTRRGVAKRLNCSIATVRRLEGRELFPEKDAKGVHRFDLSQVNALRKRLRQGSVTSARSSWLEHRRSSPVRPHRRADATSDRVEVSSAVAALQRENAELRAALAAVTSELEAIVETFE